MWGQKEKVKYLIILAEPEGLNTNNDRETSKGSWFLVHEQKYLLRQFTVSAVFSEERQILTVGP